MESRVPSFGFIEKFKEIKSEDILPGDLILIESDKKITSDLLVIEGSCLVNEALLTGESVPITKTALKNGQELTSLNVLYAGSVCLMQRDKIVLGMVVNTGWNTFKGKIVSSLVYSKTGDSLIIHQVISLMSALVILSLGLLVVLIGLDYYKDQLYLFRTLKYSSDLLTKSTQPTTIFMLYISVYFVSAKLNKRGIICIKSNKLFKAGRVDTICFDKTGTLTKNELLISGMVLPQNKNEFTETYHQIKSMRDNPRLRDISALACCCHDLHIINGKLVGDPVDIEVFKYSRATFEIIKIDSGMRVGAYENELKLINVVQPSNFVKKRLRLPKNFAYIVLRVFPFLAEKKRMGTLVYEGNRKMLEVVDTQSNRMFKYESIIMEEPGQEGSHSDIQTLEGEGTDLTPENNLNGVYLYVCKGAPEVIKEKCVPETVPEDFREVLNEFAQQGMRVLALAIKKTNDPNLEQEDYEQEMEFLGFVLLSNPVKQGTPDTIEELKRNGVNCAMITGDHLYTGVNIGYASQIIEYSQSIWMIEMDRDTQQPTFKFFTYQDLLKGEDQEKQTVKSNLVLKNNVLRVTEIEQDLDNKQSQRAISKKEILSKQNVELQDYSRIVKERGQSTLKNIMEDANNNRFYLAMDGPCVSYLYNQEGLTEDELEFLLVKTKIYGRSNPDQKRIIIERLKDFKSEDKLCVGFVGDGANDCKALNRADIGLSIGNSEASMASPFITQSDDISKVKDLLELGKFTIANFFDIYFQLNTMNMYETFALFLIVYLGYSFANWKYLADFLFYAPISLGACLTDSIGYLTPILPQGELFHPRFFSHFFSLVVLSIFVVMFLLAVLTKQYSYKWSNEIFFDLDISIEDHFVVDHDFIVTTSIMISIFVAIGVQSTYPFKASPLSNPWLMSMLFILVVIAIMCTSPTLFSGFAPVFAFFVKYARIFDYQSYDYEKLLFFSVTVGLLFFFFVKYHQFFYLYEVRPKLIFSL